MKRLPLVFLALTALPAVAAGPRRASSTFQIQLIPAVAGVEFPAPADSNSPAFWNDLGEIVLFTSVAAPTFSVGRDLTQLTAVGEATFDTPSSGGRWLESVIRADDGTLYGYYHSEPDGVCPDREITEPRIGAAVSSDDGQTWRDLGIVLTAPPGYLYCDSPNVYFGGGVGDFSVILDQDKRYLYFVFTSYAGEPGEQGIAAARISWADRDRPVGRVSKFFDGLWQEPGLEGRTTAVFPADVMWQDPGTESYWGPSLHWNTELRSYVMLLNRTVGATFGQEGISIAFSSSLEDPASWTWPETIIRGGDWYPQVMGLEDSRGTDKEAGREAWLCVGGRCTYRIVFGASAPVEISSRRAGVVASARPRREPPEGKRTSTQPRRRIRTPASAPAR
jgi:hypothetical protein